MSRNPFINLFINLAYDYVAEKLGINNPDVGPEDEFPEIGDLPDIKQLKREEGAVITNIGAPKMGKTVCAYRIAEIVGRPIYAVSPVEKVPPLVFPLKFEQLETEPPKYSTLILDDSLLYADNRSYGDPFVKVLEKIIPTSRHERKLIVIINTQSAAASDRYVLGGEIVILKPSSVLYADLERPSVKRLQDYANQYWTGKDMNWTHRHAFVITHFWKGMVRINLPNLTRTTVREVPKDEFKNT